MQLWVTQHVNCACLLPKKKLKYFACETMHSCFALQESGKNGHGIFIRISCILRFSLRLVLKLEPELLDQPNLKPKNKSHPRSEWYGYQLLLSNGFPKAWKVCTRFKGSRALWFWAIHSASQPINGWCSRHSVLHAATAMPNSVKGLCATSGDYVRVMANSCEFWCMTQCDIVELLLSLHSTYWSPAIPLTSGFTKPTRRKVQSLEELVVICAEMAQILLGK